MEPPLYFVLVSQPMRSAQAIIEEAFRLHREGNRAGAVQIYDKMMGYMEEPDANVLMGYGVILAQDGYDGLASYLMRQAIEKGEPYAPLWFNLGVSLAKLDRQDAATAAFQKSLEIDPEFPDALSGMAGQHINTGEPETAETWAREALKRAPDFPQAHNELALALLEQGKFTEAWEHWAYRWQLPDNVMKIRPYTCPKWKGEFVETLAIHGEQGLGDEILFMGAWKKLEGRARRIIIECAPRLLSLFRRSFDVECYGTHAELIENEGEPDAHIAMGDLWSITGLPDGKPYLIEPHPKPIDRRPIVGIAWKGGIPRTHKKYRTLKLEQLKPILEAPYVQFVNLQYGGDEIIGEAQQQKLFTPHDRSFGELVQWIAACDLIITSCQTNVHIAGALGIPCWVMTPKACAWRYSGTSEQMQFYESVRLYRQSEYGEWWPVIHAIASDLQTRQWTINIPIKVRRG